MDRKELLERYNFEGRTLAYTAKEMGISKERVRQLYKHYGIVRKRPSKIRAGLRDLSESKVAWLAGLYEGEGCFLTVTVQGGYEQPRAVLNMTDVDVLETVINYLGFGNLYFINKSKDNSKWKDAHTLVYNGEDAAELMKTLLPWLHGRRATKVKAVLENYEKGKVYT
jgi:hypothetical protein